jgi:hypothetical protein
LPRLETPPSGTDAWERFLLLILAGLITVALKVRTTPGMRTAAIAAVAIWALLAVVVAERAPSSSAPAGTLESKANSMFGY